LRTSGWIYPNLEDQFEPNEEEILNSLFFRETQGRKYFFPACGGQQEGFDCAARAINTALGFPFFTRREQVVRLLEKQKKINQQTAKERKSRGGISFGDI
jgi:hypothetical protein